MFCFPSDCRGLGDRAQGDMEGITQPGDGSSMQVCHSDGRELVYSVDVAKPKLRTRNAIHASRMDGRNSSTQVVSCFLSGALARTMIRNGK